MMCWGHSWKTIEINSSTAAVAFPGLLHRRTPKFLELHGCCAVQRRRATGDENRAPARKQVRSARAARGGQQPGIHPSLLLVAGSTMIVPAIRDCGPSRRRAEQPCAKRKCTNVRRHIATCGKMGSVQRDQLAPTLLGAAFPAPDLHRRYARTVCRQGRHDRTCPFLNNSKPTARGSAQIATLPAPGNA